MPVHITTFISSSLFGLPIFVLSLLILIFAVNLEEKKKLSYSWVVLVLHLTFVGIFFALSSRDFNKYGVYSDVRNLEQQYPNLDLNATGDAIVIFRNNIKDLDLMVYATNLVRDGVAPLVLVSDVENYYTSPNQIDGINPEVSALQLLGISKESILTTKLGQSIKMDAKYSCQKIKDNSFQRVILVTSALNMPRSVMLFKKFGCEVIPAPTSYVVPDNAWYDLWYPSNFKTFLKKSIPSFSNFLLEWEVNIENWAIWLKF